MSPNKYIAGPQTREQLPQQRRLAGLLAFIGRFGEATQRARGQREDRTEAENRKPQPGLLGGSLRPRFLVLFRVRRHQRGAIHDFHVAAAPQPILRHLLFQRVGQFVGQPLQDRFRQLGPGPTVRAAIRRGSGDLQGTAQGPDPFDRRVAGAFHPRVQGLARGSPTASIRACSGRRPPDRTGRPLRRRLDRICSSVSMLGKGQSLGLQKRPADDLKARTTMGACALATTGLFVV